MKIKFTSTDRRLDELDTLGRFAAYEDVGNNLIVSRAVIDALRSNPFLTSEWTIAQMVGIADSKIFGNLGIAPKQIVADGKLYDSAFGFDYKVLPEYRKSGYGIDLLERLNNIAKDKCTSDFCVSRSACAVSKLMGIATFEIRQCAFIRRSSVFLSDKLAGIKRISVCGILDFCFAFNRLLVRAITNFKTRKWELREVAANDSAFISEYCNLIRADAHRFRENINERCVQWILKNDFESQEVVFKKLYRVTVKNSLLGYVLLRGTIGGRGKIVDWQVANGMGGNECWLLLKGACVLDRIVKATVFQISATEDRLWKKLSKLLPKLPAQGATVGAADDSPLRTHDGWDVQANWRIRPSMGDSCFF